MSVILSASSPLFVSSSNFSHTYTYVHAPLLPCQPETFKTSPGYFLFGIFDYGNAIAVLQSQEKYPSMWYAASVLPPCSALDIPLETACFLGCRFSNDRGRSFQNNPVTSEPFIVRGFLPVPEAGDMVAAVFGQDDTTSPTWKVMFLDLTPFLQRPCECRVLHIFHVTAHTSCDCTPFM